MTPEQERVAARLDPVSNPAIATLRAALSSGKDAEDQFLKWRKSPMTRLFIAALNELADSPPPFSNESGDTNSVLLQYGMTSGLNLAVKLLSRPSRVYPDVLKGTQPSQDGGDALAGSYEDTLDDQLDSM